MTARIDIPPEQVRDFCLRWKVTEFSLFGSVLRDDFGPDSDVDVLVRFAPDADHSLFDRMAMIEDLRALFGREVDLVAEKNIRNPYRRRAILESKERIYAA